MDINSLKRWFRYRGEDISYWFSDAVYRMKRPFRWIRHAYQRIKYGVSYRDAWNIDLWFCNVLPKAIDYLKENSHGYPTMAIELHNKICRIEGKKPIDISTFGSNVHGENADKIHSVYLQDLSFIAFLLREATEDQCSKINPVETEVREVECVHEDIPGDKSGAKTLTYGKTARQRKIFNRWYNEERRLGKYRQKCLRKALMMLGVYLEHFWD